MTTISSVSMEQICGEAVTAVNKVLASHGIKRPSVVVTFAWKDPGDPNTYAIGTATPKRHRRALADSLACSAEEAQP